jgi:hypothetical protein
MNVDVIVTENFKKAAKRLLKKYSSLKLELSGLENQLLSNPKTGAPLGNDCFKIRLAVKSKGKGKSGGVRIITHVILKLKEIDNDLKRVYMVYIYNKSEFETISQKDIDKMIKEIKKKE